MTAQVDAIGLLCPLPVLRLRKVLLAQPPGGCVALLASDPMAAIDVPHFCAEGGHLFLDQQDMGDGVTRFTVQRGT